MNPACTPHSPSQNERVLALLRQRGRDGVDQTCFYAPHTLDGGPPITRLAARIKDLRARGYEISSEIRPGLGPLAVYVLTGGPDVGAPVAPSAAEVAAQARERHRIEQEERGDLVVVETHVRRKPAAPSPAHHAPSLFDELVGVAPPASPYDARSEAA